MDDPGYEELRCRVETLEREKHRWKVIGITSLAVLGLGLCLGCPLAVGTALIRARLVREVQAERAAAEQERQAAEEHREKQTGQKVRGTEK